MVTLFLGLLFLLQRHGATEQPKCYLGFDRNDYPGDESLTKLHRYFSFTGYWLNNPPGSKRNGWIGKRIQLDAAGFGFLLLFNGRPYAELRQGAVELGIEDASKAVQSA